MQRIATSTRVLGLFGIGKDGFQDGSPSTGAPSTQLQAAWFNAVQEEIARFIEYCGLALDGTFTQLLAAIRLLLQRGAETYAVDAGAANALVVAPSPALTAVPADGLALRVKVAASNTGATTLTLMAGTPAAAVAAVAVTRRDGTPLLPGDLVAGQVAHLTAQGGQFQLGNQVPGTAGIGQAGVIPIASAALVAAGTDNTAAVTAATIGLATMPISKGDYKVGGSSTNVLVLSSAQVIACVPAANNPNGVWVRTTGMANSDAVYALYADATPPASNRDTSKREFFAGGTGSSLQSPLFVPAGLTLYLAVGPYSTNQGNVFLTYDIL
jgi:hypothetical protein